MIPDPLSFCSTEDSEGHVLERREQQSSPEYASPIQSFRLSTTYSVAGGACDTDSEQRSDTEENQKARKPSNKDNTCIRGHKNLTGPLAATHRAAEPEYNDGKYKGFVNNHHGFTQNNNKIAERSPKGNVETSYDEEESHFSDHSQGSTTSSSSSSNIDYQIVRVDNRKQKDKHSHINVAARVLYQKEKDYCDSADDVRHLGGYHNREGDDSSLPYSEELQQPKTMSPSTNGIRERADQEKKQKVQLIRGATKGEAIGFKVQMFNTSLIPTCEKKLARFIRNPLLVPGPNSVLRCFVERRRGGVNALTPEYCLFVDFGDETERLLLAARKILKSKTSHYIICTDRKDLYSRYSTIVFILCCYRFVRVCA